VTFIVMFFFTTLLFLKATTLLIPVHFVNILLCPLSSCYRTSIYLAVSIHSLPKYKIV